MFKNKSTSSMPECQPFNHNYIYNNNVIELYASDKLEGNDLICFEAHIKGCTPCLRSVIQFKQQNIEKIVASSQASTHKSKFKVFFFAGIVFLFLVIAYS